MKLLSKLILTLALATYVSANESFRYINWDNPPHDVTFYEGDVLQFTTNEGRNSTITLVSDTENGDKSFDGVLNEDQRSFVQKALPPGKYTFQDLNSGSKAIIRVKESRELAKEVRPIDRLKDNADAANTENAQKSPNTQSAQKGSPKSDAKEASPKSDAKEASPKSDAKEASPKSDTKEASPKTDTKQGSSPKTDTKSTTQKPSSSSESSKAKEANTPANNEEAEHVEKGASNTLKASLSIISAACVLSLGYLL
ncbi:hypothetical protein ACTFIY_008152 [Dictyostelium cf. discoideum]